MDMIDVMLDTFLPVAGREAIVQLTRIGPEDVNITVVCILIQAVVLL